MENTISWFKWSNLVIIGIFVLLIFAQANKKYVLDEIDFPAVAKTVSETGMPFEYRGETNPKALGLWHPPLYEYSMGAFVKVFGANENTVRAFGMCCMLVSALLCLLIYQELFNIRGEKYYQFATIFLSLFLLHPYTIANTTLPDIDSTVLPLTFLAFIYGAVRAIRREEASRLFVWNAGYTILLSILFALNLWAKLTTPLVLIPILFAIAYVNGVSFLRALFGAARVAIFGGIVFFVTYALYCYLLSLPFGFTFQFLVHSFTKSSSSSGGLLVLLQEVLAHFEYSKQFVNWLGLPYLAVFAISVSYLIFRKGMLHSDKILIVLASAGIFVTGFYLGLTGPFGGFFKYPFPVFSIFALIIAHYFYNELFDASDAISAYKIGFGNGVKQNNVVSNKLVLIVFIAVVLIAAYIQLVYWKDIVIMEDVAVEYIYLLMLITFGLAVGIAATRYSRRPFVIYSTVILFAILLGTQFGISRSQAVAKYPTKYHYGQIGLDEAAVYLKGKLMPHEPIWGMKDIGQYASGVYYENYGTVFKAEDEISEEFKDLIENKGVRYFVVTTGIGQDRVDAYINLKLALDVCCNKDWEFANYIIYKAKQDE